MTDLENDLAALGIALPTNVFHKDLNNDGSIVHLNKASITAKMNESEWESYTFSRGIGHEK